MKSLRPSDSVYEEYNEVLNTLAQAVNPACWFNLAELQTAGIMDLPEVKADISELHDAIEEIWHFINSPMHRAMREVLAQPTAGLAKETLPIGYGGFGIRPSQPQQPASI